MYVMIVIKNSEALATIIPIMTTKLVQMYGMLKLNPFTKPTRKTTAATIIVKRPSLIYMDPMS